MSHIHNFSFISCGRFNLFLFFLIQIFTSFFSCLCFFSYQINNKVCLLVAESAGSVSVVGRVPATGCASGDIMWLLDEPNQPYEGNYYINCLLLTYTPVML